MSDPRSPIPARPSPRRAHGTPGKEEWNKDIKAYYKSVASEPVPEELQQLMASLAKAIRK